MVAYGSISVLGLSAETEHWRSGPGADIAFVRNGAIAGLGFGADSGH